ncbi:hypothetical protein [Sanguibacter suarezii]|uniref:hypothetical protein n=1 Tax=Sanguibacter suarezii TaxID=60921 RepID=UPI00082B79C5|nr:hypothetical protein [Sanguibacter suarezii]
MPTKPADRTSSVARPPSDFESHLHTLALEATPLHLVPTAGDASSQPAGPPGPWDPQQCSTVLTRWLDADLVVLLESTTTVEGTQTVTESRQLAYDQARAVLVDPRSWPQAERSGVAVHLVYNGERALEVDDGVWWSAARAGGRQPQDGAPSQAR